MAPLGALVAWITVLSFSLGAGFTIILIFLALILLNLSQELA
ncbi:MAG: hypothetical protein RID09_04690 [Coleofasciculus sp. G1-WW12-02]